MAIFIANKLPQLQKDLVCDECQMAVREVRVYVQDKDRQKQIRDFISREICTHAGSHRGMCDMVVEQFLPELFQELDVILADAKKVRAQSFQRDKTSFRPAETSASAMDTPVPPSW